MAALGDLIRDMATAGVSASFLGRVADLVHHGVGPQSAGEGESLPVGPLPVNGGDVWRPGELSAKVRFLEGMGLVTSEDVT